MRRGGGEEVVVVCNNYMLTRGAKEMKTKNNNHLPRLSSRRPARLTNVTEFELIADWATENNSNSSKEGISLIAA